MSSLLQRFKTYFTVDHIPSWLTGLAFVTGLSLVFIVPPFQKADEIVHFYKSIAVASGQLHCGATAEPGLIGYTIPRYLHELPEKTRATYILSHPNAIFPLELYTLLWQENTRYQPAIEPASCTLPLVYYLPSGLLLFPLVQLSAPSVVIFFVGRLVNFLLAFAITLFALKRAPASYRWLVLIVLCLPMTVFQFSSYSKDWATLSIGLLFFVELLRMKFSQTPSYKHLFFVGILSALLVLSRPTYVPLVFLMLLYLPKVKLKKYRRSALLMFGLPIVSGVAFLYLFAAPLWNKFLFLWNQPYVDQVDARLQLLHIAQHPWQFLHVLWTTLEKDWYFYWNSMIGILGWLDYGLPKIVYTIYYCLFFCIVWKHIPHSTAFSRKEIRSFTIIVASTFFLILFSHYIFSTAVAAGHIVGVQGRYFIPLLPFVFIALSGTYYYWKKQLAVLIGVGIVLITVGTTIHRYYTNDADYISSASSDPTAQTKNAARLQVSSETIVKTEVSPDAYVVGLRLYLSDKQSPSLQPYLIRLYNPTCTAEQWSQAIAAPDLIDRAYIDVQIPLFIADSAPLCWSLAPLQSDLGEKTYLTVPLVNGTNEPVVSPLYLYRD